MAVTTTCTCDPERAPEPTFADCHQHDPSKRTPEMLEAHLESLRESRAASLRYAGLYGANLDYEQDRRS